MSGGFRCDNGRPSITNCAIVMGGDTLDEGIMDDRAPPMKNHTSPATDVPPQKMKNPSPVIREIDKIDNNKEG